VIPGVAGTSMADRMDDILIVDDTLPNLRLLSSMLSKHGYKVRAVPNGSMALTAVASSPPDLILLDINMPGLNGHEVCERLKGDETTRDIPVIFISALDKAEDKVSSFASGGVDYITKPFQVEEVLARVDCHLSISSLQKRLEEANDMLERRVEERTDELAQTIVKLEEQIAERRRAEADRTELEGQLHQSQKMDALGRLAGGVVHDFNNLLTVIIGYAEILNYQSDDEVNDEVEQILRAGDQAASLTQQLLAFSRRQAMEPKVVFLNDVVENAAKMLKPMVGEHIAWTTELDAELGKIMVDPGQIEQSIVNLLFNARDAMPDGGQLSIRTANENKQAPESEVSASYVSLTVSDTGIGMDEETRRRVFEPFFTTKAVGEGTGLGLSTVHGVVNQSGGWIELDSRPGKGSSFVLHFPRLIDDVAVDERPSFSATDLRGSETVLLVDNDAGVRGIVGTTLRESGYTVVEALDGAHALESWKKGAVPVHLLITDVIMRRMGGKDLAEWLVPLQDQLRVIYMSGYMDEGTARYGLLERGMYFLQKPFSRNDLLAKVREVLDAPAPSS
jgi:two-component system cell cycle sensor histidine kinase/response regulator CckA